MAGAEQVADVRVEVLGAMAVSCGTAVVTGHELGGRRARVALAALALAPGPVPASRLASIIWADQPPATWPAALRGIIRGLRTALAGIGAGGERVIATVPAGYQLGAGIHVDLRLTDAALRAAAALIDQGRYEAALEAAEPLAQLSGEHLLPGEDAEWLDAERRELDAMALRGLEIVARAAGRLGDHHRAVAAGRRAVAASPLDERSHRTLIRALHRAGDRAGVVRAYEECRQLLTEQLGVDPDPQTIEVYLTALGDAGVGGAARLPAPGSAFFGRDAEVARLTLAIREPGLVTVCGPGGIGKSRLAIHVARLASYFDGGRMWVSLGSISQDEFVGSTVAMLIGLPPGADDAVSLLAGHLAPVGRTLLILDGCEAVVDGTASLLTGLLALCPQLTAVVTSRVPLAIDGERVIGLDRLPFPARGSRSELVASSQVRLLADRVRESGGQLVIDDAAAPLVAELCRRCGGLPLALELAAAQLTAMSVADLLDHLPELMAGDDDQLRGVARSSYALLDDDEAAVFRRFAVLDGQVALPLVRDVVSGGAITPVRVVRILRELTARGLLAVDRSGPRWRYHQEDDLHRLARELLTSAGEEDEAFRRLADAVSAVLPDSPKAAPAPYLEPIGEVLAAVRSVLGAAVEGRLARDTGLDVAFRMHRYWAATNVAEGRFWLSRLIADDPRSRPAAYATYALGYLSYWSGDVAAAMGELQAAVEMLGDEPDEYAARALIYLGGIADDLDRGEEALDFIRRSIVAAAPFGVDLQVGAAIGMGCVLAERADRQAAGFAARAIELCRSGGSAEQLAATLPTAAMVCWQVGEVDEARRYVAEAMPLLADSRRIARVVLLSAAAGVALADGDLDSAVELGKIADADASDLGIERELPQIRCMIARGLLAGGDAVAAAAYARGAVEAARSLSFGFPLAVCLETAALVCLAGPAGQADAVHLLSAAAVIRARGERPGPPTLRPAVDAALRLVPAQAAGQAFGQAGDQADIAARAIAALAAVSQPSAPDCSSRSAR
jgi:predicted ATPase/DNA-binding SARP family transcriptional activator